MARLVYLASPYSLGDQALNVRRAIEAADKLLEKGYIPFMPHLCHFWHFISPKPYETWLEIDRAILERCDALLRLEGISEGADQEVKFAKELGLDVYYSIEELQGEGK